jgi:hypothetical protein
MPSALRVVAPAVLLTPLLPVTLSRTSPSSPPSFSSPSSRAKALALALMGRLGRPDEVEAWREIGGGANLADVVAPVFVEVGGLIGRDEGGGLMVVDCVMADATGGWNGSAWTFNLDEDEDVGSFEVVSSTSITSSSFESLAFSAVSGISSSALVELSMGSLSDRHSSTRLEILLKISTLD